MGNNITPYTITNGEKYTFFYHYITNLLKTVRLKKELY